ncbi:MAG: 30S ribosomal protein S18 [Thermoleophilia bacterium]
MAQQQTRRKRTALPLKKRKRVQITDDQIRYTNVEGLKRFLSDRGKIRSRRMTGLSRRQQTLAAREIKRAREMGLLPFVMPKMERARGGRSDRGGRGEDRDEQTMASAEASQATEAPRYEEVVEVVEIDEIPAAVLEDEV